MEKPIRVLQFGAGNFGRGGQSTIVLNFGMNTDNKKIIFDYVVNIISDEKYIDIIGEKGGKVYLLNSKKRNFYNKVKDIFSMNRIISKNNYKIIHINTDNAFIAFIIGILGKINKVSKIIIHSHSTGTNQNKIKILFHNISKFFLPFIGDEFLACSNPAGEWLYPKKYLDKVKTINNGIDIEKYKFNLEKRKQLRKEMNLENKFILGHIGRFSDVKNHKFLIEIFNEVQQIEKESILLLIGNGELEQKIKEQVKKLDLKDKVIFLGTTNKVEDYLQIMDIFIFPSKFEGLGLVVIEAQAAALKVIASDRIPKEAKLTDYLKFLSLEELPQKWAEEILKYRRGYKRIDTRKEVEKAGYSIKLSAKELEKIYLGNTR